MSQCQVCKHAFIHIVKYCSSSEIALHYRNIIVTKLLVLWVLLSLEENMILKEHVECVVAKTYFQDRKAQQNIGTVVNKSSPLCGETESQE